LFSNTTTLTPKQKIGQDGEIAVARLLEKEGFTILERNYRQRCGEIDIIAQKGELLCFVEIKTRTTEHFAISQVVTKSKQQKIIKTAQRFAVSRATTNKVLRFDVAIVTGTTPAFTINYIPNAFTKRSVSPY
jgi:putative endonuclease